MMTLGHQREILQQRNGESAKSDTAYQSLQCEEAMKGVKSPQNSISYLTYR